MLGCFVLSKIRSIWEIWSEKKNTEHFDRIGLSGEKNSKFFAQIVQSDLICEEECNQGEDEEEDILLLTQITASNHERAAYLLYAQANSASYRQRNEKWAVAVEWRLSVAD